MKSGLTRENYEVSGCEFGLDCTVEMLARLEHPVMPDANQAFALERTQVNDETLLQLLVGVRVGNENGNHEGAPLAVTASSLPQIAVECLACQHESTRLSNPAIALA